jgi:CRISPR-associated endonuclease Cas3-HD
VAEAAEKRLQKDEWRTGLLSAGFEGRYGLKPEAMLEAVRACGLLHDLGKLQEPWQRWAAAAQRARHSDYEHVVPLAHTDFDPENPEDQRRERNLDVKRPPHAPASAYYGRAFLPVLMHSVAEAQRAYVASACAAAVLAHHGGWWPADFELNPPPLSAGWETAVTQAIGRAGGTESLASLERYRVEKFLKATTDADSLAEWWPLLAYLTRTLRLSDQRATAERGCNE